MTVLQGHLGKYVWNRRLWRYDWPTRLNINCWRGAILTQVLNRRRIGLRYGISRTSDIFLYVGVRKHPRMLFPFNWRRRVFKIITNLKIDYIIDDLLLGEGIWTRRKSWCSSRHWRFLIMFLHSHIINAHMVVLSRGLLVHFISVVMILIVIAYRSLTSL